jgi:hypothetical protein
MNVWNFMRWLRGKTLHTLAREAPFTVRSVQEDALTVFIHSSKMERIITRSEIESTFNELWVSREMSRIAIEDLHSDTNNTYVAALLAELPQVKFSRNPIRLYWRPASERFQQDTPPTE